MHQAPATLLDFLRHGEPTGGSRFRGHGVDDPLSAHGWQQMRSTTAALDGWQRVVSSPMRRCREFAQWLAAERGLPLELQEDLKEVGFGSWEGAARAELIASRADEFEAFYRDPVNNRPAGAEPLDRFGARVAAVFERLVAEYRGEHLLVVAHAGVIRAALGHVTRAPATNWYRTMVKKGAVTRFTHDHRGARLVAHGWRPRL
jgi:broad specificity phosphatase PhoE